MTNSERLTVLEQNIRLFKIASAGGIVQGGFGKLEKGGTEEERLVNLEKSFDQFNISSNLPVSGSLDKGFVIG